MTISCICVTFGRVAHVQSALKSFLDQDYGGPRELVILNTCPQQRFAGNFPNVKLVNLDSRPETLGTARNKAIEASSGDVILVHDDDDSALPNHLSTYAKHFTEGVDWVWLDKEFYAEKIAIKSIAPGQMPLFAFTKKAWAAVGGYPNETVGEDRSLVGKITSRFQGKKVPLQPHEITFIYRWNNGTFHVSGGGLDKPGQMTAHERIGREVERRIHIGSEPSGAIQLKPRYIDVEPSAMVRHFLSTYKPPGSQSGVGMVMLGRLGDIINILPIAKHISETHSKPYIVVSREFAPLLSGVSYVEPYPVDLKNDQLHEALALARNTFRHVINCQIWGQNWTQERKTSAYNEESWRVAGFHHKFHDLTWGPVFDRRDRVREVEIVKKSRSTPKPLLVVNLTRSISSNFPEGKDLLQTVRDRWSRKLEIVDVADWVLPNFYDLLGLIEAAVAVLCIDTSLLHLCGATRTPLIALTNPNPWLGTARRSAGVSIPYSQAVASPDCVHAAIENAIRFNAEFGGLRRDCGRAPAQLAAAAPTRRLFHCVEMHEELNPRERVRKEHAQKSWDALYSRGVIPCHYWKYARTAKDIGDPRPLPYLKDALKFALDQAGPDDVIFWTNDDNYLHQELPDELLFHCSVWGVCCAQRCEFVGEPVPDGLPPSEHARRGRRHTGRDVFAFTGQWLEANWEEIPDVILGASDFDLLLACMVRLEWGIQSDRNSLEETIWPAEIRRGFVSHQAHDQAWRKPENVDSAPSQLHNRTLFRDWAAKHLPDLKFNQNLAI